MTASLQVVTPRGPALLVHYHTLNITDMTISEQCAVHK